MTEGKFLCIEGSDGTGKGTQHKLLVERLKNEGFSVLNLTFPQYTKPSSDLVKLYLNGEFGNPTELDPRLSSLVFAIDRVGAKDSINKAMEIGSIVLADRFTASNMAHQGAKLPNKSERIKFFGWLHQLEHNIMQIPEPDMHIVLHLPAKIAQQRVLNKEKRDYTSQKLDGHEADLTYLRHAEQTYLDLAETFPDRFTVVNCVDGTHEKSIKEIHEEVWAIVNGLGANDGTG